MRNPLRPHSLPRTLAMAIAMAFGSVTFAQEQMPTISEASTSQPEASDEQERPAGASSSSALANPGLVDYFLVWKPDKGEPKDLAQHGVVKRYQWKNRMAISLPEPAIAALLKHSHVLYLQKIQPMGSPPDLRRPAPLPGPPSGSAQASSLEGPIQGMTASAPWRSGAYVYDGAGNIINIGTVAEPNSDGRTNYFVYDTLGRLKKGTAHTESANNVEEYEYDAFGNIISKTTNGSTMMFPTDPTTNRLSGDAGAEYDQAGNLRRHGTFIYYWDPHSMMLQTAGTLPSTHFVYTADDERIGVYHEGEDYWKWTIRDLDGKVLREFEEGPQPPGSHQWYWVEDWVYRDGQLLGAERPKVNGIMDRVFFHLDHLGTPRLVTNVFGQKISEHVYFPFGVEATSIRQEIVRGSERDEPMKFTGHQRDFITGTWTETQTYLDYMHARAHNPVLGRFLSVDQVTDIERNLDAPQNWNRYSYTANSPVNRVDEDGHFWDYFADAIGIGYDAYQLYKDPSWGNAGWLAADIVLGIIPLVPNTGAIRLAGEGLQQATALAKRTGSVVQEGKALQKELDFANELATKGYDVVVRGTRAEGADLVINGMHYELKTLQSASQNAVENNIRKGLSQAGRVIIDGRQAGLSHETALHALNKLKRQGRLTNAEEIRVLTLTGEFRYTP